jgi:hypothetical protein
MEKRGDSKNPRWEARYTMAQLLDPEFRLPLARTAIGRPREEAPLDYASVGGLDFKEVH